MAAPSFVNASVGATDAGGAWSSTPSTPTTAGNVFIFQVLQDGTTDGAVAFSIWGSIENLAGTLNSMTQIVGPNGDGSWPIGSSAVARQFLFIGRATSTSTPGLSAGSNSTSEDLYFRWYQFTNVSTGTTLATVIENSTAGGTANTAATDGTITDAGVTTLGPDRLALQFIGINDDNALADFTGETGGDWTEAVAEYAESSGTDASIGLQIAYPGVASLNSISFLAVYGGSGTNEQQAQSFASGAGGTLTGVALYAARSTSPTDDLTVEIQTDAAGVPSGTVVGSAATIACSSFPISLSTLTVFPVSASLSASTTYWIVARRSGARDTVNYPFLGTASSNTYSDGTPATRGSGTWTAGTNDVGFSVLIGSGSTINGGTTTNSDSADGWGVVGFALIGTTPSTRQPRYGFVHYNDPAIV